MKELYTSSHVWTLFESFLVDMVTVSGILDKSRAEILTQDTSKFEFRILR